MSGCGCVISGVDGVAPEKELPTALLWALYLKSTLLEMCGDLAAAEHVVEEVAAFLSLFDCLSVSLSIICYPSTQCILHTPTAIDMYCKKAKLQKKAGNAALAAGKFVYRSTYQSTYSPIPFARSDNGQLPPLGPAGSVP
jgi:hypothetical protein